MLVFFKGHIHSIWRLPGSQSRGRIRDAAVTYATATAMQDQPTEGGQESKLCPQGY